MNLPDDFADEILELLEQSAQNLENDWWNCNGGKYAHDSIRAEQAVVRAAVDRLNGLMAAPSCRVCRDRSIARPGMDHDCKFFLDD